jgi:ribosomal protein S6
LNTYEALIIFPSQLRDDELKVAVERVEKEIDRAEGVRVGTEVAGKRSFARPMQKRDSGVYVRIGFSMNPAAMAGFRARLKLQESIFRVQVTRVDEPLKEPVRVAVVGDDGRPESMEG